MTGFRIDTTNRFELLPPTNHEESLDTDSNVTKSAIEASSFVDRTYTAEQLATEAAIVALICARSTRT